MESLPETFAATREALRALCCYAVAPARKARTGRIGLRPYDGAIATPPFDDEIWNAPFGAVLGRADLAGEPDAAAAALAFVSRCVESLSRRAGR
jgi:hypothetical protein